MQINTRARRMFMSLQRIFIIRWVQTLGFSGRYTKKNTLIQHTRKARVRHNVKSIENRHNSLKIQRNCVKYILYRSVKSRHFETELNMSLEHVAP
jgi:hypothetical protein